MNGLDGKFRGKCKESTFLGGDRRKVLSSYFPPYFPSNLLKTLGPFLTFLTHVPPRARRGESGRRRVNLWKTRLWKTLVRRRS